MDNAIVADDKDLMSLEKSEVDFEQLLLSVKDGVEHNRIDAFKQLINIIKINNTLENSALTQDINALIESLRFTDTPKALCECENDSAMPYEDTINAYTKKQFAKLFSPFILDLI